MKPEKLADEELRTALRYVGETLGEVNAGYIRSHIAAMEAERDQAEATRDAEMALHQAAESALAQVAAERDVLHARVDELCQQGQADHRALHDALGWAHVWHNTSLPPPWRAVTALIAERDEYDLRLQTELRGAARLRETYGAREDETFEAFVERLYQDSRALAAIRQRAADEKRMVTVQPSHVAGLVTRAIDRILGADEGGSAQPPEKSATYTIPALPVDAQADALVSKWCAEQEPVAAPLRSPDTTSEIDEPMPEASRQIGSATAELFATVREIVDEMSEVTEDRPAWRVLRKDLVTLERRMGAMERALESVATWRKKGTDGCVLPRAIGEEVSSALTDAPPAPMLEEVVALRAELARWKREVSAALDRLPAAVRVREGGGEEDVLASLTVSIQQRSAQLRRPAPPLVPPEGQCAYPIGGGVTCLLPLGHDGGHGVWRSSPPPAETLIYERGGYVLGCPSSAKCDPETPGVYECGAQCSRRCHAGAAAITRSFTLEASKAGDAAYEAVFRIYGDATRARQVADEVLAALRSTGGGR